MPLNRDLYLTTKPGVERELNVMQSMRTPDSQGILAGFPAFDAHAQFGATVQDILRIEPPPPIYSATNLSLTEVKDNSSTIATVATTNLLRFQTQASPSDNDDISIETALNITPTQNKTYVGFIRLQVSSAANLGFAFGLWTASAQPLAADPANGVFLVKNKNAATVRGEVIENTNASDDSGTLATLSDATDVVLGFAFRIGTSASVGTSGVWMVNGVPSAFTVAQLDALYKIYGTTNPTDIVGGLGFRVNSTTQRNALVHSARIFREV